VAPVPTGAATGPVIVTVNGLPSNPLTFTVTSTGPAISGLGPSKGPAQMEFLIFAATGAGFGTSPGKVTFNGQTVPVIGGWNNYTLEVQVPAGTALGNYNVVVTNSTGQASNAAQFNVTNPFGCN